MRCINESLAAALLAPLVWATSAGAAPTVEKVSLEYVVDATCPDVDVFRAHLSELTSRAQLAPIGEGSRHLEVTVRFEHGEFVGQLAISVGVDTEPAQRVVRGATCKEVVEALALAAALAVDPDALGGAPPGESPVEPVELTESPVPEPEPIIEPIIEPESTPESPEPEERPTVFAHLNVSAWGLLIPSLETTNGPIVLGGSLGLEVKNRGWTGAPSLHGVIAVGRNVPGGEQQVSLTWFPLVRGSLCPTWLSWAPAWQLGPCLVGEGGVLRSRGVGSLAPLPGAHRPWAAAGAEVRLRRAMGPLSPTGAPGWSLEVQVGGLVPLVEQEYRALQVQEDVTILQVRRTPSLFVGLGLVGPEL